MPKPPVKSGWKAQAERMKQDLLKRTEEAANRQKEGSSSRGSYFIKEKIANLPFFNPDAGEHIIDIVPWVAGRQDPRNPEGAYAYVLDLWIHYNVGEGNDAVVCPKLNFNKRCPICEYMKKNRLERKEWQQTKAKRRTVYLVWPHDEEGKLEKKGIHVWDVAHWYFEDKITELAKKPRGGGYVLFQSPDKDGKQIRFNIKKGKYTDKDTGETGDRKDFTGHQFIERDEDLPDKIVNHGLHLDELVKMKPTFAEIEKLFLGSDAEGEEEAEQPEETAEEAPADEDQQPEEEEAEEEAPAEEEEEEAEEEAPEADEFEGMSRDELKMYIVKNGLKETVKCYKNDTDDDIRNKIREAVGGGEEEAEEEPEPPKKAAPKAAAKPAAKPAPAAKGKGGKAPECPAYGTYGKDADQFEECLQCAHYKTCSAESEK